MFGKTDNVMGGGKYAARKERRGLGRDQHEDVEKDLIKSREEKFNLSRVLLEENQGNLNLGGGRMEDHLDGKIMGVRNGNGGGGYVKNPPCSSWQFTSLYAL